MLEKKKRRPSYSPEFKEEAVSKSLEVGVTKASRELGISPITLRSWILKSQASTSQQAGKPSYEELEKENRKLKKELGYVTEINEVLKKAQQFSQTRSWEVYLGQRNKEGKTFHPNRFSLFSFWGESKWLLQLETKFTNDSLC